MKIPLIVFTVLFLTVAFFGAAISQTKSISQNLDEKVYKADEVDQKAEITKRPRVKITSECGTEKNSSGRVKIELVLNKSGKITEAKLVESSECGYFNNRALELAKKIKFKPALKDGKTVSQFAFVSYEYNFFVVK